MELGIVVKGGFYETPCVGRGLSGGCIGASKRKGQDVYKRQGEDGAVKTIETFV